VCCWLWTLCQTIQHRVVLILFSLNLQTITITRMLSASITNLPAADWQLLRQPSVVCSRSWHLYPLPLDDPDECEASLIAALCLASQLYVRSFARCTIDWTKVIQCRLVFQHICSIVPVGVKFSCTADLSPQTSGVETTSPTPSAAFTGCEIQSVSTYKYKAAVSLTCPVGEHSALLA